jgi:hypothetical protein
MPAGCDFVCRNECCNYYGTGFTITGPWPLGDIDEVIDSVDDKDEFIRLKEEGRRFACIKFPNVNDIYPERYRINFWSVEGNCIWQYDIVVEDEDDIESAIADSDIPDSCPKTGSELLNYKEVIDEGIECPSCNEKLMQNRWFTKEE